MTNVDFFLLFSEKHLDFFIISIIVVGIYCYIANKLANSWLNPIKFIVLQSGVGMGVACFLFMEGESRPEPFFYVILSSFLYWVILILLFPKKIRALKATIRDENNYTFALFVILYFGNILLTFFSYSRFGIPIFNENSRLATYTGSGGFGVIIRITSYMQVYSLFYIFKKYASFHVSKVKLILWLLPLLILGVLSGSRSSFLIIVFAYWGFEKFYYGHDIFISQYKSLMIVFLAVSVFTFSLQYSSNLLDGVISFAERVAACGDLYWFSLPNDVWQDVTIKTPYKDMIVGFLGPLRLMAETETDVPIGYQLSQLVNYGFDKMTGALELFPVSSLIYFGYFGGLIMVIIQAFLTCVFYMFFYRRSDSLIISSLLYYGFYKSLDLFTVLRNVSGHLFDFCLNVALVTFIIVVLRIFLLYSSASKNN